MDSFGKLGLSQINLRGERFMSNWKMVPVILLAVTGVAFEQGRSPAAEQISVGTGSSVAVTPRQVVVLGNLPQVTAADVAAHPATFRPQNRMTDEEWNNRSKVSQKGSTSASGPSAAPPKIGDTTLTTRTPGTFVAFPGSGENGLTPSDMAIAAGSYLVPSGTSGYVIQVVNATIRVMDKATGATLAGYPKSLNTFLGLPASASTFDPRAFYDISFDRFVVVIDEAQLANSRGFIHIAASQTGNPTGAWTLYTIQLGATGNCPDFPTLGYDKVGIYIGANIFACSPAGFGGFTNNNFLMMNKAQVYASAGVNFWVQFGFSVGGNLVDTLQPANVISPPDNPRAEFFMNSYFCPNFCNGVVVWAVSNQFGFISGGPSPEFSGITVPTAFNYANSPGASEPGCNNCIDAGDTRISGSINYIAGSLFWSVTTSSGVGSPVQTAIEWGEIRDMSLSDNNARCTGAFTNACPDLTAASLGQEQCFGCSGWSVAGGGAYYGTLQPDLEKNVTMVYNFSANPTPYYPGTVYASRRVNFPLGQMHDSGIFLAIGTTFYNQGRWGDYTATSVDLFDPNPENVAMWFSGMYSTTGGLWGTFIGSSSFRQNSTIP
jgi:hypothetical protein